MNEFNQVCRTERQIYVSGVVLDANTNEVLPFANIYLTQDTSVGTAANENGEFFIEVPYQSAVSVSYVGYETTEFIADTKLERVLLTPDDQLGTVYLEGENKKKKGYGWLWLLLLGGLVVTSTSGDDNKSTTKAPIKAKI